MDISGTDPRTRTGLFLWPWTNYPGVATNPAANMHNQSIMMGTSGNFAGAMGANMLGMSNNVSGPVNATNMRDDSFESIYQRFSYPGAHAAQMSHLLPQNQHLTPNEARHLSRDRHVDVNGSVHSSLSPQSLHNSRTHTPSVHRLLSPPPPPPPSAQPQQRQLQRNSLNNNDLVGSTDPSSHAVTFAAFASAAAANSGSMGSGDMNSPQQNGLLLPPGIHTSRNMSLSRGSSASNEHVLDSLCNGLNMSNPQFPNFQVNSSNLLKGAGHHHNASFSASSCHSLSSPNIKSDLMSSYGFRRQQLKGFSNTAVALAAAAVASDQFTAVHGKVQGHHNGDECDARTPTDESNNKQLTDGMNSGRGADLHDSTVSHQAGVNESRSMASKGSSIDNNNNNNNTNNSNNPSTQVSAHSGIPAGTSYPFSATSSKSPFSDTPDLHRRGVESVGVSHVPSWGPMDLVRNGRFMSSLRDSSAALLLYNHNQSMQDCSSDCSTDYHNGRPLDQQQHQQQQHPLLKENHCKREDVEPARSDSNLTMKHENGAVSMDCSANSSNGPYSHAAKGYKCKICQHVSLGFEK